MIEEAKQIVNSNGDLEGAKKLLEKVIRADGSDDEAKELLPGINRRIRVKKVVEDALKVLDSVSLTGYNEAVIELSDVLNELIVSGLDPSNQVRIRKILNDLEKRNHERN